MSINQIEQGDGVYPTILLERMEDDAPSRLYVMGEAAILRNRLLGLICSIQCPGSIVIKILDAIRSLRGAGVVVIGGFHSPMEKECLDILLRGNQPVILCPAKGLANLRIGEMPRRAVKEGRLLVLSPFAESIQRMTVAQAILRNNMIAALADKVWVPHAAPGGKIWTTVYAALERQQSLLTFGHDANRALCDAGARPLSEFLDNIEPGISPWRCE